MTPTRADLLVIGLGAMGSATVDAASARGVSVIGLDAFEQGHRNGSSHGPTRILRRSVEEGPQYVPLVLDALPRWRQLGDDAGAPVFVANGAIRVAPRGSALHRAFLTTAEQCRLDHEHLDAAALRREFPAFDVPDDFEAMYEREAGTLFAERAVRALQDRAGHAGATLRFGARVQSWAPDGDGVAVHTSDATYRAARLVITAGAWVTQLVSDLGLPLVAERVVNVTFTPLDRALVTADRLPAFLIDDDDDAVYGIAAIDGLGVKFGAAGTRTDPDHVDRVVTENEVGRLRRFADRFLPAASGPVETTLTCLYTVAPDGHFVIDRHPAHPQIVIASPCSGHGFKYTTAIGPLLVDLALTGRTQIPIDAFSIDRFVVPATDRPA